MRLIAGAAAAAAVLAVHAAPAMADWREPFTSAHPINFDAARNASTPSLADVGGKLTVAWAEDNTVGDAGSASVIRVAQLGAAADRWNQLVGDISLRSTASSYNPSVAAVGGAPWVAWMENYDGPFDSQVRVARPGSPLGWEHVGDGDRPINRNKVNSHAERPVIIGDGGTRPYVAFWEIAPNSGTGSVLAPDLAAPAGAWVVRLNAAGTTWDTVGGGPANPAPAPGKAAGLKDGLSPDIAIVDGHLWVTFLQARQSDAGAVVFEVRAARLSDDGQSWQQVPPLALPAGFASEGQERPPRIAAVGGTPVVAIGLRSASDERVLVARLRADGSGWDTLGGGFASPAGAHAGDPAIADIGGAPWVTWNENGQGGAARLADGAWIVAGGPIKAGNSGGAADLTRFADLPWVAFSAFDGQNPNPGQNGRPCCDQIRVARLTPDFGGGIAYPAATTAAVLQTVQTYGLRYPLGVELTPHGGAMNTAPMTALGDSNALAELRGLTPATIYSYRAFATAGTPEKLYGPAGQFATPPSEAAPTPAPAPQPLAAQVTRNALVLGILRAPASVRRGHRVSLALLASDGGRATLQVRRIGKRTGKLIAKSIGAGRSTIAWTPSRSSVGRYRLTVTVRSADGRTARDAVTVRIVR